MDWLLFFSSLPSKPVGNRVRVWRKLTKSGAVQLKGSAYVLPAGADHAQFLQRLVAEIVGMGGEAAFARVGRVETVPDQEIAALFERRKVSEYRVCEGALDGLERRIDGARQSGSAPSAKGLASQLERLRKDFEEKRRTDFFAAAVGRELDARLARAQASLAALDGAAGEATRPPAIRPRSIDDYRERLWATRRDPFVDRMASAWLIRRFIDPAAVFTFIVETDVEGSAADAVAFDVAGGEFTHVGDLCTFEVLVRSFGLADDGLARLAEIVHDLDVKDDRYKRPAAAGVEEVLAGVRRTARDDAEALERGMAIFELLYAAGSR